MSAEAGTDPRIFDAPGFDGPDILDRPSGNVDRSGPISALDELRAALQTEVNSEPVSLLVPGREGVSLTFGTRVPAENIKAWRKRCKDRHSESGVDEVRFSATVIGNQCQSVAINGKVALDADNEPMTFASPEFREMLGAHSALEAVTRLYSSDAAVLAAADEILKAAGYGEEAIRAEDPTTPR